MSRRLVAAKEKRRPVSVRQERNQPKRLNLDERVEPASASRLVWDTNLDAFSKAAFTRSLHAPSKLGTSSYPTRPSTYSSPERWLTLKTSTTSRSATPAGCRKSGDPAAYRIFTWRFARPPLPNPACDFRSAPGFQSMFPHSWVSEAT